MKKIRLTISILFILIIGYLGLIYATSAFLSSKYFINTSKHILKSKYDMDLDIRNLKVEITPLLNADVNLDSLIIKNNNTVGLDIQNLDVNVQKCKIRNINSDLISANLDVLTKLKKENTKNKKKKSFNLNKIPNVNIKQLEIVRNENEKLLVKSNQFVISDENGKKNLDVVLTINIERIMHPISIGKISSLYIEDNNLKANKLPISVGKTKVVIDGSILNNGRLDDFTIKGDKIPAKETMATLLFLQKYSEHERKFMENFIDWSGTVYVDMIYKNNDLSGYMRADNLSAKMLPFKIPVYFKKAEFFLKDKTIKSFATGDFGGEVITHKLLVTELFNKQKKEVFGEVKSKATTQLAAKYLPKGVEIKNHCNIEVDYYLKNRKPDVKYYIDIPASSAIIIKDFYTNIKDKNKKIFVRTFKDGNDFYIKDIRFSVQGQDKYKDILFGDGYLKKINDKMTPQYVNLNTNGYIPNSIIGSFKQYLIGGAFSGKLKFDFINEQITGKFEVVDTIFNHFHVESASVIADKSIAKIKANGTYKKEKFNCDTEVKNDFKDKIYVNYMNLFLDKYIVKKDNNQSKPAKKFDLTAQPNKELSANVRKINMDIDKYNIAVNSIVVKDYPINNIKLFGSIKNGIFEYNMPEFDFANGKVFANGVYDFNIDSSIVDFTAKNIDSSIIAEKFFNLKNQIEGTANATLHSKTGKDWLNWEANANFEILNGALPGLQTLELSNISNTFKKNKKLSDYVKMKAEKRGNVQSHIKGKFTCDDFYINNIDITVQHEFVSLYIDGLYNYIDQTGLIDIWGKYDNSAVKKVKVMHIPLNWIINTVIQSEYTKEKYQEKLNQIPPIGIDNVNAKYFKINVKNDKTQTEITKKRLK